ncbi:MAG: hypothetical protein H7Y09_09705 [Chitinophagaceae bacterium]|nr:hypothetical protein [Anaerolineae bacterium]
MRADGVDDDPTMTISSASLSYCRGLSGIRAIATQKAQLQSKLNAPV